MRTLALVLVAALLAGCTTLGPIRASDPQQAAAQGEEARTEAAGVKLVVRADGWRSWPERYMHQVTPIEVRLVNDGPTPLEVHPERFTLEREGRPPIPALLAGDLPRAMRFDGPPDRDLSAYAGLPSPTEVSKSVYPYDWRGLTNPSAAARPVSAHGPDPRPYPEGVVAPGHSADFMLFFDVPAEGLTTFTVVVTLTAEGGAPLGAVRVPFRRT